MIATALRVFALWLMVTTTLAVADTKDDSCARPSQDNLRRDASSYYRLGVACEKLGEHRQAVEAFEHARQLEPGNPELLAALAGAYLRLDQLSDALNVLADLVPLRSRTIGSLLLKESPDDGAPEQANRAVSFYRKRLDDARARKDPGAEAKAADDLAGALQDLDQYDEALSFYSQALRYYLKAGDHVHIAEEYIGLGEVHQLVGDLDQGEQWFRDALVEARKARDENLQLRILGFLASIASDREDFHEEIEARLNDATNALHDLLAQSHLDDATRFPITPDGAVGFQIMGEVAALQRHSEFSIALLRLSLALHRAAKSRVFMGEMSEDFYRLGLAYSEAQRLDEAWSTLEESLKLDAERGDTND